MTEKMTKMAEKIAGKIRKYGLGNVNGDTVVFVDPDSLDVEVKERELDEYRRINVVDASHFVDLDGGVEPILRMEWIEEFAISHAEYAECPLWQQRPLWEEWLELDD